MKSLDRKLGWGRTHFTERQRSAQFPRSGELNAKEPTSTMANVYVRALSVSASSLMNKVAKEERTSKKYETHGCRALSRRVERGETIDA